ncbi:alcohol dehydrogenase-like [Condylostylus longicornis]|uniref:alcohol dehydrogenase-like n=1 Tax=Condylostylus longicornis TaxID=2530218 RepID=UPI00244DDD98|nr:alcohol dehydrogenase-like [Condylostylus longicornis]
MQAYQVTEHGKPLERRQVAKPIPTGHQVLAKTTVSGVCHTDVHVAAGDWGTLKLPLTPGHEGVGVVEAVGSEVTTIKIGDRIGVAWLGSSCMDCYLCKDGRENMCENQKQTGFVQDGSFAEYFIADERFAAKIPSGVSDAEAAPVLCAGVTSYKALRMANAPAGARIVIAGACGGLGHLAIQYAKAMGYEVIALDVFDEAKEVMTKELGADFIINLGRREKVSCRKAQFH